MRPLVSATVHSGGSSSISRRPAFRLWGLAPAALLLSGLFTLWAGPLAAPAAAAPAPAAPAPSVAAPSGPVVAWGDNTFGQTTVPAGLSGVTAIAAGWYHSLALRANGTVVAWGYNYDGQADVPAGLSGVTAIAAGAPTASL